jgi:hypothetical protein
MTNESDVASSTMHVLLIRGFDTDHDSAEGALTYASFDAFFSSTDHRHRHAIHHFHYHPDEDLRVVYARLCRRLRRQSYEILIGHSMGGGLLFRYATREHPRRILAYRRLIFLMPLLYRRPIFASIARHAPGVARLVCPPRCMHVSLRRHDDAHGGLGRFWEELTRWVGCNQIVQMYNDVMPSTDGAIVDFFRQRPNAVMLYASDEMINVIPESIRRRIGPNQCITVDGKHECFRDASFAQGFFRRFHDVVRRSADGERFAECIVPPTHPSH